MTYPIYITFGVLPSIIWLLFYLRKDQHPESNKMVLKIFFWGMLAAIPAVFLEMGFFDMIKDFGLSGTIANILNIFIGVALIEEFLKYLIVRNQVLNHREFDEPIDAMLYMIIAALGFAAVENILILFQLGPAILWGKAFELSIFRFLGATFLHTLSSGLIGYFLALSILEKKGRIKLLVLGISLATLLHGLYNFSIMKIEGELKLLIPLLILAGLALFISFGFKRLRKLESVCKI